MSTKNNLFIWILLSMLRNSEIVFKEFEENNDDFEIL